MYTTFGLSMCASFVVTIFSLFLSLYFWLHLGLKRPQMLLYIFLALFFFEALYLLHSYIFFFHFKFPFESLLPKSSRQRFVAEYRTNRMSTLEFASCCCWWCGSKYTLTLLMPFLLEPLTLKDALSLNRFVWFPL